MLGSERFHGDGKLKNPIAAMTMGVIDVNPEGRFELAYAKAWFKLTQRDMRPTARHLGNEAPDEALAKVLGTLGQIQQAFNVGGDRAEHSGVSRRRWRPSNSGPTYPSTYP